MNEGNAAPIFILALTTSFRRCPDLVSGHLEVRGAPIGKVPQRFLVRDRFVDRVRI